MNFETLFDEVFWVFNGWGVLFLVLYIISLAAHIVITEKLGSGTPLRMVTGAANWILLLLIVIFSGFIAAIVSFVLGFIGGPLMAKIILEVDLKK